MCIDREDVMAAARVLSYLKTEQEDAEETARWVEQAARKVILAPGDVRSVKHCRSLVSTAVKKLGRLDFS
jgi:hypothetical protein